MSHMTRSYDINFFLAVDILRSTMVDKLPNDLEGMEVSMHRLLSLIDDVYKYVDDVVVRYKNLPFYLFCSHCF